MPIYLISTRTLNYPRFLLYRLYRVTHVILYLFVIPLRCQSGAGDFFLRWQMWWSARPMMHNIWKVSWGWLALLRVSALLSLNQCLVARWCSHSCVYIYARTYHSAEAVTICRPSPSPCECEIIVYHRIKWDAMWDVNSNLISRAFHRQLRPLLCFRIYRMFGN